MAHQQAKIASESAQLQQAAFLQGRAELLKKAEELSALCGVPVVLVMQGPGEAEPTVWPAGLGAMDMLRRYAAMADDASEVKGVADDCKELLRQRVEELRKTVDSSKIDDRELEIDHVLGDLVLCRRRIDDLPAELAAGVTSALEKRTKAVADRINFQCPPEGAASAAPTAGAGMDDDSPVELDGGEISY